MTMAMISPDLQAFSRSQHSAPPRHLGQRYNQDGIFLPERGNTVVCHLQDGSDTERVLRAARQRYLAMPEARQLAFTAPESHHMTLFQGIIETRREPTYWPAGVPLDAPVDTMTELMLERLAPYDGGAAFAVEATRALPTGLVVRGITDADRRAMAGWRNDLAALLGYKHPDHDSYEFHITFAYLTDWFDNAALPDWQDMLDDVLAMIRVQAPVLELRAPAFCSFEDMNWFEELLPLG
jgi:hypothetical protein